MPTYKDTDAFIELLATIPYDGGVVEITNTTEEITFLGVPGQPDFARLDMTIYPAGRVPEPKSLKEYFFAWLNVVVSYERFIERRLREEFGFAGTPIVLQQRPRERRKR